MTLTPAPDVGHPDGTLTMKRIPALPFAQRHPVRTIEDIRRIEEVPLEQALTVRSTYEIMYNSAAAFGERTALAMLVHGEPDEEPIRVSYRELLGGIHRTANLLHELGLAATDAVGILMPACIEYHLALWAGEAAAIVQPLNPLLTEDKLVALLNASGAKALFAWGADDEAGYWSKALRIRSRVPTLQHIIRVPSFAERALPDAAEHARRGCESAPGLIDFTSASAHQPDDRLISGREIESTDIAAYFHTGGTTGSPKLARHSHGAQVFTAWACVQVQGTGPDDVTINGYPLFHVAGVLPGALAALSAGVTTIIPTPTLLRNRTVVANYWKLVDRYRPTLLSAVPTMLATLANIPLDGADISSIRYCRTGAAALPPELAARFERQFGLHVHESLGMTEMAGISTVTPPGVIGPAGCVGFPLPFVRMRIVSFGANGEPTDRDVAPGEQGVILFRSPNLYSGFVDPQDDARAFTKDGWLVSGDMGWMDSEGRLNLSGRSKDLIIRSGHNIDPKIIEDALGAHPAVQVCAAVGAPDAYAGELPVAYAALRPGHAATEQELLAFAAARVDEAPARPKAVHIVDHIPTTNVGKIYKPELRAMATAGVAMDMIHHVARAAGLAPEDHPRVDRQGEHVTVTIETPAARAVAEQFRAALTSMPASIDIRFRD